jgi:hypothetical protein
VKQIALTLSVLLMSVAAMSQTYSNANLNGNYAYNIGTPAYYTWSKTFTCPTNSSITYTPVGTTVTTAVGSGVAAFDGAGTFSASSTSIGKLNASGSANTMSVTWSSTCAVTKINYGHIVYMSPATTTITGTYSVTSTGTGTLTITGQTGTLSIQLADTTGGISHTAFFTSTQTSGQTIGTGQARLQ